MTAKIDLERRIRRAFEPRFELSSGLWQKKTSNSVKEYHKKSPKSTKLGTDNRPRGYLTFSDNFWSLDTTKSGADFDLVK